MEGVDSKTKHQEIEGTQKLFEKKTGQKLETSEKNNINKLEKSRGSSHTKVWNFTDHNERTQRKINQKLAKFAG